MRAFLVVVALVGCGRVGFRQQGEIDRGDAGATDTLDGGAGDVGATDGPQLGDPNGFWEVAEARVTSTGEVRSGSDLANGIRGNLRIASSQLHQRFLLLAAGVLDKYSTGSSTLVIAGDRWIANDGQIVAALTARWNGPDDLALTWIPDDPVTVGTPLLDMIRIVRATPPPASLVGTKTLTRVAYRDVPEFAADACAPNLGGESQIVTGTIEVTEELLVNVDFNFQFFTTADCTGARSTQENIGFGYLEVEDARYRLWLSLDTYDPVAMAGALAITASSTRLERDACEPAASTACADLPIAAALTP